jgi:hypothetical protein
VIEMVPTKPGSRRKRILLVIGTVLAVLLGAGGTYVAVMGGFPASADMPRPTPAPLTVVTLPPVIPRAPSPTSLASGDTTATQTPLTSQQQAAITTPGVSPTAAGSSESPAPEQSPGEPKPSKTHPTPRRSVR